MKARQRRDFFKIVERLVEKRVWFCMQSQNKSEFYNISVDDIHGKTHHINSYDLGEVEERLKVIWGHLLEESAPAPKPSLSGLPRP